MKHQNQATNDIEKSTSSGGVRSSASDITVNEESNLLGGPKLPELSALSLNGNKVTLQSPDVVPCGTVSVASQIPSKLSPETSLTEANLNYQTAFGTSETNVTLH